MKFVEIDGRRYYAKFNMAAFLELEQLTGLSIAEILATIDSNPVVLLKSFYLALKYGADEAHKRFDMTYSAFVEIATGNDELQTELANIIVADWKAIEEMAQQKQEAKEGQKKTNPSGTTTQE